MIEITQAAKDRFLEVIKAEGREGHGLRVSVSGGNTPRPEFSLNFVGPDETKEDDLVEDAGPFKIYVDPDSAKFLEGASVDFIDTLTESGFKVDAPNAGVAGPTAEIADVDRQVASRRCPTTRPSPSAISPVTSHCSSYPFGDRRIVSDPEYSVSCALRPLMSQRPVQGSPSSSGTVGFGAVNSARATTDAMMTTPAMRALRETRGRVTN